MLDKLINQNVAITGHSGGIGSALERAFVSRGFSAVGFSLDNGYDLAKTDDIKRIINEAECCAVFVNCAEYGFAQTELLYGIAKRWRKTPNGRAIINISSTSGDGNYDFLHPYAVQKSSLDRAAYQVWAAIPEIRIMTIRPGIVDTRMSRKYQGRKLPAERIAEAAMWMLSQPEDTLVREISIMPSGPEAPGVYGNRSRFRRNENE